MRIFKALIGAILILSVIVILNPNASKMAKGVIGGTNQGITEIAKFSFEYSPNMSFVGFDPGVALYNGRSIRGFDKKGNKLFDKEWRTNDFDIKGFEDRILFLDRIKRTLIIIDKKGNVIKQISFSEKPLIIEPVAKGRFAVHYVYDLNEKAEGIRIFTGSGKQIQDIQISDISILIVNQNAEKDGFTVSGISINGDRLYNNIMNYSKNGELLSADKTENRIFTGLIHNAQAAVLWEENYVEIRDQTLGYVSSIYSDSSIIGIEEFDGGFAVADELNSIRVYSYDATEKKVYKYAEKLNGIAAAGNKCLLYTQRSVDILGEECSYDIKSDISDVINIDNQHIAVVCRGEVRILLLD